MTPFGMAWRAVLLLCFVPALAARCAEGNAVDEGLKWLAQHQEEDGHWDSAKYWAETKNDTTVTSLALMSFLGAGHSEKVGAYKDNVKRAVAWLRQHQEANGRIFDKTDTVRGAGEGGAICFAILGLAEAAAMGRVAETRAAAQKAVDYCAKIYPIEAKADGGKVSYTFNPKGDTLIAGWCIFALKSAKVAGMRVENEAIDAAVRYLDSVEHKATDAADAPMIYWYRPTEQSSEQNSQERVCAAALVGRQYVGAKKDLLQPSVNYLVKLGGMPEWDEAGEKVDMCYWWMGTLCLFQQGGDLWKEWSAGLKKALVEKQRHDGDFGGSWDLGGRAGKDWGRIGQTALAIMALEVYYRFPTEK